MTVDRFKEKQIKDAATKSQQADLATLTVMGDESPDVPLWPVVIAIQEELARTEHRDYHPDYLPTVHRSSDSVAVIWKSGIRGNVEMFLSVQCTDRPVPRLQPIVETEVLGEVLSMIEDINRNDSGPALIMVKLAFEAFIKNGWLVTGLDADPETNRHGVQVYTKDRKYLMDIQVDFAVVQEDIEHQEK